MGQSHVSQVPQILTLEQICSYFYVRTTPRRKRVTDPLLGSILDILHHHVRQANKDLQAASMYAPIHGPLMAIRYMLSNLMTNKFEEIVRQSVKDWKAAITEILQVTKDISQLMWSHTHYITYRSATEVLLTPLNLIYHLINNVSGEWRISH